MLLVDAGIMCAENDMIGIDYSIRDYEYLRSRADQVLGLVITHGHEDHIGAIHHVLNEIPVPVYATRLTRGLIEGKLARHGALDNAVLHTVEAGKSLVLGPFHIEFFHICHSIPDAVGLLIPTPPRLALHISDFKFATPPVAGRPPHHDQLA